MCSPEKVQNEISLFHDDNDSRNSADEEDTQQTSYHVDGRRKCPAKRIMLKTPEPRFENVAKKQCLGVKLSAEGATRKEVHATQLCFKCRNSIGSALKLQQPAPFFEGVAVLNGEFANISINDYKERYLILFFYPLDFTFVRPTEITSFSDRLSEFATIFCEVIGCSTDSQYSHLAWTNLNHKDGGIGKLNYPLLSDKNMNIARSYGVLDEETGVPFRGMFIIDRNQNLRQIIINDLPISCSVDEALRLVYAIQFNDINGNV